MATRKGSIRKMLVGSRAFKRRGWLSINEENSHRHSLDLEVRSETSRDGKGTSCLHNVTMLTLTDTILSMSIRVGELRKSTLASKIT